MKPINLLKGYDKLPTEPRITTIHSIYNIKHCGELNKIPDFHQQTYCNAAH